MPDIIVHDGPTPPQDPQFVQRVALPQTIAGLAAGQYRVLNTSASPPVTVYDAIAGLPSFTTTLDQMIEVTGFAPGSDPISFTIDSGPYAGAFIYTVDADVLAVGPIALVPPAITGTPENSRTLTGIPGLWVSFSPSVTRQSEFLRDGVPLSNADYSDELYDFYIVDQSVDGGTTIQYRETLTDAAGTRVSVRTGLSVEAGPAPEGAFEPTDTRIISSGNATQTTLTAVNFGEPHASRVIEMEIGGRIGTSAGTITGVTIGGVTATPVSSEAGTFAHSSDGTMIAAIWSAPVPEGTSGNVVIAYDAARQPHLIAQAWRKVGLVSDAPVFTSGSTPGNGTVSRTVEMAQGDRVVFGIASRRGMGTGNDMFTPSANLAVVVDESPSAASGTSSAQLFLGTDFAEATGAQAYTATSLSSGSSSSVYWTRKIRAAG